MGEQLGEEAELEERWQGLAHHQRKEWKALSFLRLGLHGLFWLCASPGKPWCQDLSPFNTLGSNSGDRVRQSCAGVWQLKRLCCEQPSAIVQEPMWAGQRGSHLARHGPTGAWGNPCPGGDGEGHSWGSPPLQRSGSGLGGARAAEPWAGHEWCRCWQVGGSCPGSRGAFVPGGAAALGGSLRGWGASRGDDAGGGEVPGR